MVISVANPLLFLTGIGVGLGKPISDNADPSLQNGPYLAFLTPGLLAAASMQTAFVDSAGPVYESTGPEGHYGPIGFAFASVGLAVVTFLRDWQDFQIIQLAMLPMFLFATTFYPLDVYPRPLRIAVECLPLYQSIELLRGPFLGSPGPGLIVPVLYLLALGALGLAVASRRLDGILRT
ncbi:ABC transporter permease [Streptomyces sp. NPDC006923]|uniref:ABC transporter permease n=1 Tax=Streptomyces sp. NPDC006923 TaxID=3155355 RepID=UPI0033FBD028